MAEITRLLQDRPDAPHAVEEYARDVLVRLRGAPEAGVDFSPEVMEQLDGVKESACRALLEVDNLVIDGVLEDSD